MENNENLIYDPQLSEYNPRSIALKEELRMLVESLELPKGDNGFFAGLMRKMMLMTSGQN